MPSGTVAAIGMEEAEKHSAVDALLPDIQEAAIPLDSACWPPR